MSLNQVLILGSNPSVKSPDSSPFHENTRSGQMLRTWLEGIDPKKYVLANLSDIKTVNNKPLSARNVDKERLIALTKDFAGVVGLGKTVHETLWKLKISHIEMPHPSGLNRKLNDKQYKEFAIMTLRRYIDDNC